MAFIINEIPRTYIQDELLYEELLHAFFSEVHGGLDEMTPSSSIFCYTNEL